MRKFCREKIVEFQQNNYPILIRTKLYFPLLICTKKILWPADEIAMVLMFYNGSLQYGNKIIKPYPRPESRIGQFYFATKEELDLCQIFTLGHHCR